MAATCRLATQNLNWLAHWQLTKAKAKCRQSWMLLALFDSDFDASIHPEFVRKSLKACIIPFNVCICDSAWRSLALQRPGTGSKQMTAASVTSARTAKQVQCVKQLALQASETHSWPGDTARSVSGSRDAVISDNSSKFHVRALRMASRPTGIDITANKQTNDKDRQ